MCSAGKRGPAGEQVCTVTAVFIGTQVSSAALGRLDNTLGPRSPLWQPQKKKKHTHRHTPPQVHIHTQIAREQHIYFMHKQTDRSQNVLIKFYQLK